MIGLAAVGPASFIIPLELTLALVALLGGGGGIVTVVSWIVTRRKTKAEVEQTLALARKTSAEAEAVASETWRKLAVDIEERMGKRIDGLEERIAQTEHDLGVIDGNLGLVASHIQHTWDWIDDGLNGTPPTRPITVVEIVTERLGHRPQRRTQAALIVPVEVDTPQHITEQ